VAVLAEWLDRLGDRFDGPGVRAIALLGSHARGDAGPLSDVDLLRLTEGGRLPDAGSHLVDGRLVVVGDAAPAEVEAWFGRPERAVATIPGLRGGRPLRDRGGAFAALQARARRFVWDEAMQRKADGFAREQVIGWAEEVHKGLAGLASGDVSRLLDAAFGLSWGLNRAVGVQRGVPLTGPGGDPPGWYEQVEQAVGPDAEWSRLRRRAFGLDGSPLGDRVAAGLRLYRATVELLGDVVDAPVVRDAVRLIREAHLD
jgi:hypothetical protein